MINKFQSYVDNIQESNKKNLFILPLIILVVMQNRFFLRNGFCFYSQFYINNKT